LSPDGSLAYFTCANGLYVRDVGAGQTRKVSQEGCSASLVKSVSSAVFYWCGSGSGQAGDVYRYDLGDGDRNCVSCPGPGLSAGVSIGTNPGAGPDQIAVAADGSRVYFKSPKVLAPGAAPGGIYRVDVATGELAYVGFIGSSNVGDDATSSEAISPDGSILVFGSSDSSLNPLGGTSNGGTHQYYLYDDRDRSLVCISCPQDGSQPSQGESTSLLNLTSMAQTASGATPLADDGTLAFATATPLVRSDQNTPRNGGDPETGTDVYEWRNGRLLLVTDGLTEWPVGSVPMVNGVSPSGRDLFFTASAQYTLDARDSYYRLYDARIGGGIDFPAEPTPCPLEVCQGTPRGAPEEQPPGSAGFAGPGNLGEPKAARCAKGKSRRHGRCVSKKTGKKRPKQQRGSHHRRTAR
jgi:hypothetical protein